MTLSFDVQRLTDQAAIRAFLNQDRGMTAYALGDLDDAYWPQSTYYGARVGGKLVTVLLTYHGLEPIIFTGFGDPNGMAAIFDDLLLPEEMYYVMPPEMEWILAAWYEGLDEHLHREWRMVLDPQDFAAPEPIQETVSRLGPEHADVLTALYALAAEPGEAIVSFSPWQIAHGVFYGVWDGDALIAAAGTHVWSLAEHVAAVGNVFTRPDCRGRGLATACTGAVVREAAAAGMNPVVLNVKQGNTPAIRVYEKLGFRTGGVFIEGPALRREK